MPTIEIDIPDELLSNYKSVSEVKREIYEDFIADEYKKGNISINYPSILQEIQYIHSCSIK